MKLRLKMMMMLTIASVVTVNISACDLQPHYVPVDVNKVLQDAANAIINNQNPSFTNFLFTKTKTTVGAFSSEITANISDFLNNNRGEDFSNITAKITNGNTNITAKTPISLQLSWDSATTNCTFTGELIPLQKYVDDKFAPFENSKQTLTIAAKSDFYHDLVNAGADFKSKKAYLTVNKQSQSFWDNFKSWNEQSQYFLITNILDPVFNKIIKDNTKPVTGLTFANFDIALFSEEKVAKIIAITGTKQFIAPNHDVITAPYLTIDLQGKSSDGTFSNLYHHLTFLFRL